MNLFIYLNNYYIYIVMKNKYILNYEFNENNMTKFIKAYINKFKRKNDYNIYIKEIRRKKNKSYNITYTQYLNKNKIISSIISSLEYTEDVIRIDENNYNIISNYENSFFSLICDSQIKKINNKIIFESKFEISLLNFNMNSLFQEFINNSFILQRKDEEKILNENNNILNLINENINEVLNI